MSHWDFSRRLDGEHHAPPSGPADTAYEPDSMLGADDAWPAEDAGQADEARPARDWWPAGAAAARHPGQAENPWPAQSPWSARERGPDGEGWPEGADGSPGEDWSSDDAWDDDGTGPYPVTYERDDFVATALQPAIQPATPPAAPWDPWPPAPHPEPPDAPEAGEAPESQSAGSWGDAARGQRPGNWQAGFAGLGRPDASAAGHARPASPSHGRSVREPGLPGEGHPGPAGGDDHQAGDDGWAGDGRRGGGRYASRGGRRWPILAGVVVAGAAVGAGAVLLASRPPAGEAGRGGQAGPSGQAAATSAARPARASASPSATASAAAAPLTLAQARGILAGYTAANNNANAQRSDTLLAAVETGSSYAIDAGLYQAQQGTAPYPAFGPARATYYIPRAEPAAGPRWFAVQVANAFASSPQKVTSSEYLLFTQSAPGGPWQDVLEPYLLAGASVPQVAVGADGLATAVSPDAASVAVAPGQLAAATAASVDGTAAGAGQQAIAAPGNLADVNDQRFWQGKLPGGKVTDAHTPAAGPAGQEFALQTAGGGALVLYADAAQLTITPPAGGTLRLTIPGFYSPDQSLSQAGVSYLEQFATYDPPAGGKAPTVIADYSGITGKS